MNKSIIKIVFSATLLASSLAVQAGNRDRVGAAGATELLLNPWGMSNGFFGMNTANVSGIDAMKTNIAGLAFVENMDIGISHSELLAGTGINLNNLGAAFKFGNAGVLGINILSMNFGEIPVTTYAQTTTTVGKFKPQFMNLNLAFSKEFSNSIHAGIGATFVSEAITDIHANALCFEAGVQYITGKNDNFHFGLTLRNIGTNARFSGNGFAANLDAPQNVNYSLTQSVPADKFSLPTYLNFGIAYDFYLDKNHLENENDKPKHRLTALGSFTSNSYTNDYIGLGLEYGFKEKIMLRGAYRYEKNINSVTLGGTFYTGLAVGATVKVNIGNMPTAFDYSFRPTHRPNNGSHCFTMRFMLRKNKAAQPES